VWGQLVRAGDGTSNNLIEADNGSSDADFLNKMRTALREAKESKACLAKIRRASTIITNMEKRLAEAKKNRRRN
jgi:four helix bundle protein